MVYLTAASKALDLVLKCQQSLDSSFNREVLGEAQYIAVLVAPFRHCCGTTYSFF